MMTISTARHWIRSPLQQRRGVAMLEFALATPLLLFLGLSGIEYTNLALMNLRLSQAALNLADNASRVGIDSGLSTTQLREVDVNDIFAGVRKYGERWKLTTNGRVTLSSLENVNGSQVLHWQRCIGMMSGATWDSSFGTTDINAGTDATAATAGTAMPAGIGPPGSKVTAPPGSAVMFVEINYRFQPLIDSAWIGVRAQRITYIASFIVRDRRDYTQVFNPSPGAQRATCNKYNA